MFDLNGKVAVVTGGTGVLGARMCEALAQAGASVVILATTEYKVNALADQLTESGYSALGCVADVLDRASLDSTADTVLSRFGRVDILVNAAGGNRPQATTAPDRTFFDLPEDALQWVFNLNFIGTLLPSQVFARLMASAGEGSIINISSMASLQPLTRVLAYGSAKAAVNNFTQWLAVHLAQEYNPAIRVNAIAPGFFLTEQNRYLLTDEGTGALTERGQKIIGHTPMRRFGQPDDLSGTLLWLASDAARFVTGIIVPVDGGFSAYSGV